MGISGLLRQGRANGVASDCASGAARADATCRGPASPYARGRSALTGSRPEAGSVRSGHFKQIISLCERRSQLAPPRQLQLAPPRALTRPPGATDLSIRCRGREIDSLQNYRSDQSCPSPYGLRHSPASLLAASGHVRGRGRGDHRSLARDVPLDPRARHRRSRPGRQKTGERADR